MPSGPSAYFKFWDHFDNRARTSDDGEPRLDLLVRMTPAQRRRTERELLARLEGDPWNDGWVIDALGALRSAEAVPWLRDCLQGPVAEDAAIALWRIQRWQGTVKVLARVLRAEPGREESRPPSLVRRIDAARYLAEVGTPRAREILANVANRRSGVPYRLQRTIELLLT